MAASAVLSRLRLPRRIVTVLEGESLLNDAAALVLYRFAVAAAASGSFAAGDGAFTFLLLGLGGVTCGYALGRLAVWLTPRLEDTLLETAMSFLVCYASYLAAEALHLSGVIAVVTTGLVLGQAQHTALSPRSRLAARAVWDFVEFLLNSLVFILIGLQLNSILGRLSSWDSLHLAGLAAAIALTLVVSRFLWVFLAGWLPRQLPAIGRRDPMPPWPHFVLVSWAGMRGVVSLAAALALPLAFPQRDLIVFLAFTAILATLVLQGTTLGWLIRRLRVEEVPHDGGIDPMEARGRQVIAQAELEEIERRLDDPLEGAIAADLVGEYRDHARHLQRTAERHGAAAAERAARRRLRLQALEAGRARLIAHHRAGHLHDEALARLALELDLEELRVRQVLGDERTEAERRAARRPAPAAILSDAVA